jgi:hypothetical protein
MYFEVKLFRLIPLCLYISFAALVAPQLEYASVISNYIPSADAYELDPGTRSWESSVLLASFLLFIAVMNVLERLHGLHKGRQASIIPYSNLSLL